MDEYSEPSRIRAAAAARAEENSYSKLMDAKEEKSIPLNPRQKLLDEARAITSADRNKAYGSPEDNFTNIANLWTAYAGAQAKPGWKFSSMDVAMMMTLVKIARLSTNAGHRDSLVDIAGYAACGADIQESMKTPK